MGPFNKKSFAETTATDFLVKIKAMAKTFVIGDIHGAYRALRQCLDRSGFDYDSDILISLGDVADGWPDTNTCITELLRIKNLVYILGNHDFWTLEWMESNVVEDIWYSQGGKATIDSYPNGVPEEHLRFLKEARLYYEWENKLFVHAGIDPKIPVQHNSVQTLLWDRNLSRMVLDFHLKGIDVNLTPYEEVFIGHTPVPSEKPIHCCGVWLMDTGAGWSGRLSMMNVNTRELFSSDPVPELYPGIKGRQKN